MKYKEMLCWIDEEEKKALLLVNTQGIKIIFVNNEESFISQLNDCVFPVISINNVKLNLVRSFPELRFYILYQNVGINPIPPQSYDVLLESNVTPNSKRRSVFKANELIDLFEERDIVY